MITLPLAIHVGPEVNESEVEDWVVQLNVYYAEAGVRFERAELRRLTEGELILRNNRDRHRFKRRLRERTINVFVVDEIHDPWPSAATRRAAAREDFEPSGRLGGAHIPAAGHRPSSYAIVCGGNLPLVMAHELGHILGANHHRDSTNIMSYGRVRTHFDEDQRSRFRRRAARLVRRRDVRRRRR